MKRIYRKEAGRKDGGKEGRKDGGNIIQSYSYMYSYIIILYDI